MGTFVVKINGFFKVYTLPMESKSGGGNTSFQKLLTLLDKTLFREPLNSFHKIKTYFYNKTI